MSDGPSIHFKNSFIAKCLQFKSTLEFFASSYGKGQVDGIGGTIKRLAVYIVTSHKGKMSDSHSFVKAVESSPSVKLLHVTSTDII